MKYTDFIACIIAANGHDVVIEPGNPIGMHPVLDSLKNYGWSGKYITVNPDQDWEIGEKGYVSDETHGRGGLRIGGVLTEDGFRKRMNESGIINTKGDGRDAKLINRILELTNPKNPAYIISGAIGVLLSYFDMDGSELSIVSADVVNKISSAWAENLTKTGIKRAYFTDADCPISEGWHVSLRGIDSVSLDHFCNNLRSSGWQVKKSSPRLNWRSSSLVIADR